MKTLYTYSKIIILFCAGIVLSKHTSAQLNGAYTVGGATPDFPTLVAAVNALNTSGVSGPVIFNIRPGTYTGQITMNNVAGVSNINRITIQSESGNRNDVIINFTPTAAANNFIVKLENTSYVTIKDITVTTTATTYGRLIQFTDNASYNTIQNCLLDGVGTSSNMAGIYGDDIKGTGNSVVGNTFTNGYYGIYLSGTSATLANMMKNTVIENNTFNNVYYYSNYLYYQDNLKFRNNIINKTDNGTHYGARLYYCNNGLEFSNNRIVMDGTGTRYGIYGYYNDGALLMNNNTVKITNSGTAYGLRMYYCDGTDTDMGWIMNNTVAIDAGTSAAYGFYSYYSKYQNIINNSVNVKSTSASTEAARFYYSSTSYTNNTIRNNIFSNETGDGVALYVYSYNPAYNNSWDYNNIYSGKATLLVETGSPAATFSTLPAWITASGQDINSISYDPGFINTTDLRPDVNNAASWSLNGRAIHIVGNNADFSGNARVENIQDGVPDIGAYEFEPAVEPPLAIAVPQVAGKGDVQVFSFGQKEVATVIWGNNAEVSALEVRQYSGRRASGITTISPAGSMYFYTDIQPLGSNVNHDFQLKLNYMDTWLGNMPSEGVVRMAEQVPGYSWMVYSNARSNPDVNANTITAPAMSRFGILTGLPDGSVPSAFVYTLGKNVVCIGDSVKLSAEPANGDYYKWYINGSPIPGGEGQGYNIFTAKQAGNYSVAITFGAVTVESVPAVISTIAPPNAVVKANGPLTYCTGSGLELNAGNEPGVTYQWLLNGSSIAGANGAKYQVTQAGNYTVIAENLGCATPSAITTVTAGPLQVMLGNDTTYCEMKDVFAKLNAGYPGATYTWNTGETSQVIEVKRPGTYWVKVDGGPNCIDIDTIQVGIDPLPSANGISYLKNGNNYQFNVAGAVNTSSMMWIFSDGTTSTAATPSKDIPGSLFVRVVLFNGCGSDTLQLGYPLSVDEVVADESVTVFPNPATDNITVRMNGNTNIHEVMVVNNVGTVVSRMSNINAKEHTISIVNLPAGHYILRAVTSAGANTTPFIISR